MEITAAEPRRRGLLQLFIDGEAAVKIDAETFALSGLKPGDSISDEELRALIAGSNERRANEKALNLLERRNHSKKELEEKLTRAGIAKDAARDAASHMEELGLLDDESYARDCAREMFERKLYGKLRVRQELRQKGIDPALIEELLEEYGGEDATLSNMRNILSKKYPSYMEDEKVRRRAAAALNRMGYSYEDIRGAMKSEG